MIHKYTKQLLISKRKAGRAATCPFACECPEQDIIISFLEKYRRFVTERMGYNMDIFTAKWTAHKTKTIISDNHMQYSKDLMC